MRRRYYRDDDAAAAEFAVWSIGLTAVGIAALIKALIPAPSTYTPVAPDDPTHVAPLLEQLRLTRLNAPTVDLGDLKPPEDLRDVQAWKGVLGKFGKVKIKPPDENRAIIERTDEKYPFTFPTIVGDPHAYRIYPAQGPADPQASAQLMQAVTAAAPRVTFEIIADGHETLWQIADYEGRYPPQILIDHVRAHHAGATVEIIDPNVLPERHYPFYRQLLLFGLTNEYAAPLPFFGDSKGNDPLTTLSRRMDFLDPVRDERIQYQMFSFVYSLEASNRAIKRLMRGTVRPTSGIIEDKTDPLAGFDLKLLNAKIDSRLYHTFVAVTVESRDEQRLIELAQIAHDVMQVRLPRYNGMGIVGSPNLRRAIETEEQASVAWFETLLTVMVQTHKTEWRQLLSVLSPQEMATLWHLPDETYTGENIAWAAPTVPPEVLVEGKVPGERVVIGDVKRSGKATAVSLAVTDRAAHQSIFGKIQTGKSTLLHNLIHQDIAAGRGVAVIDPHGKLIDDILSRSIPADRHQDVVLLDCGRDDYPVPLNPFRIPSGVKFASAFNYLYWITRKIYADIWLTGETDMVMRNVIQALLCDPEAIPMDIRRLFSSDRYRKHVVELMRANEYVSLETLAYWNDFDVRSLGDKRETANPVFSRTRAFVGNRTLEMMTCHPDGLDYQALIRERKIVLINLRGEEIAAEAGNLGALFLGGFYLASEALGYLPEGAPPRFYLYIDEVERFITSPLPDMFSQARKFGLSLTMANQYLEQLSKETYQAVMGTVGTHFLFELGIEDASKLAKLVEPDVEHEALTQLGLYRMAVKTRASGKSLPAFVSPTRRMPEISPSPYLRPTEVPGFKPGKEVRSWIASRIAEDHPAPAPQKIEKKTRKRKVDDYE